MIIASGSISGGGVTAGAAGAVSGAVGTLPTSGQAAGSGMFLQGSGTVTFAPTAGKTVTVSDVISDEQGFLANSGYAAAAGFTAGAWSLAKTGTGTLTLSGANSYTGGTTLSEGTLSLGHNKALGSGLVVASSGTTIDIQDGVDISSALAIDRDHTINVGAGAAGTYSGTISETSLASVLRKTGTGMLTLSGANSYSGGTTLSEGTLSLGHNRALGSGSVIASGGTTIDIQNGIDISNALVIDGNHAINVGAGAAATYSGTISEADLAMLRKTGAGTLTLSGINSRSGVTMIEAGTLAVANASALGSGAVFMAGGKLLSTATLGFTNNVVINEGVSTTIAAAAGTTLDIAGRIFSVNNGSTVVFGSSADTGTITLGGNAFIGKSTSVVVAGGTLKASNHSVGDLTERAESTTVAADATLDFNGQTASGSSPIISNLQGSGTVTNSGDIKIAQGNFAGTIMGATNLTKIGTGTLTLSGENSYSGDTNIEAGTIAMTNASALGSGPVMIGGGAALVSKADMSFTNQVDVKSGETGTIAAAAGTTMNFDAATLSVFGSTIVFGSSTDTGTIAINSGMAADISTSITIAGGTLKDGNGSVGKITELALATTVRSGATLDFNGKSSPSLIRNLQGNGTVTNSAGISVSQGNFAGAITGGARLTKSGAGTLTLSGTSTYTGGTSVDAGTLIVGVGNTGSILGPVEVKSGARLGGSGTIGGTVTVASGATHGAGNSVGTQTINGNYVNRGTLEVEATPSGADRLNVNGTVDISGARLNLLLTPPTSASWHVLNGPFVLIANNGTDAVTGSFASVGDLNKLVFLNHLINYAGGDGNDVTLTLTRNDVSVGDVGQSRNQVATGVAVDGLVLNDPVRAALMLSTDEGKVRGALDALSGEVHASLSGAFIEAGGQLRDVASSRIRSAFGDVAAADIPVMAYGEGGTEFVAADSDRFVAWGQALGNWRSADGDGNAAGFSHSGGGMLAGGDATFGDGFRLGLLAGYSRTSFETDARASSGSSDNFHLGVYGGRHFGAVALRAGATYTRHAVDTTRSVVFPGFSEVLKASYDAGTAQAFVEIGYKVEMGRGAFEPFAGLAYVSTSADGFTEIGGAAALTNGGNSFDSTMTTLGLRAATDVSLGDAKASLRGMVGWRHAFGDVAPSSAVAFADGDSFTVHGTPIARDALLVEAGLDVVVSPKASLGLSYTGQLANGAQQHGVNASLAVKF
ncbi:autotransporter domain-containing protein [Aminobacter sp. BA135]|uniref:autotransporter domain-containing protein n=1 Tax=Aminobacter sp. BA135 TaxID=537596 RepID=UPI003D7B4BAB